jgi:hypothetical protein
MRNIFYILSAVGSVIICILAFILPSNPNEIIPAISVMGFDKPLWLAIIITGLFFYNALLYGVYDKLKEKYGKN